MTKLDGSGYRDRPVVVAGAGLAGSAAADALLRLGARVTITDRTRTDRAERLVARGASFRRDLQTPPRETSQVVASPGFRPDHPLLTAAAAAGIEVIGDVELAWRLRSAAGSAAPPATWLAVTGTNGKTTAVRMLEAMLRAAGRRVVAAGNVGLPLVTAVCDPRPYDVIAVELSSFQLHWSRSLHPAAGALLNVAPDHLDWHGSFDAYAAAKARVLRAGVAVGNADAPLVARLLAGAPASSRVSFTLGPPRVGQLGVADDRLVDRAYGADPAGHPVELATVGQVRPPGSHNVANALAAAALARSYGAPAPAVRAGLAEFVPDRHRNEQVATVRGVAFVDDSKATNPHAAGASLAAYPRVVWIAGGLLKGADVDDLVAAHVRRLSGVVLMGADRGAIRQAIARHAPDLPLAEVTRTDDGAMAEVVRAAAALASPGDTVLLAPAAASFDMFADYVARADAFAAAVAALAGEAG